MRLEFAHMFPLNSRAPIASTNLISDGKIPVSPQFPNLEPFVMATYGVAPSYILIQIHVKLMGALLFKTNGRAQSSLYPVRPFALSNGHGICLGEP